MNKPTDKAIQQVRNNLPKVVIFGRVNVGKSTLFNKLSGKNAAIVSKTAGTTRDSNEGGAEWQGAQFQLIDTGGILDEKFLRGKHKLKRIKPAANDIDALVQRDVKQHIQQADVILFTVDAKAGLTPQDSSMALLLKRLLRTNQTVLLVVNKTDTARDRQQLAEFHKLALGEPLAVSAATGAGTGDLLDVITAHIKQPAKSNLAMEPWNNGAIKVIILGKPNVGKSSLLNAIIGENKIIVSALAHTTREPQDVTVVYRDRRLTFMDTAGIIRRTSKATKDPLIKAGVAKSRALIPHADVGLLVVDVTDEVSHQESALAADVLAHGVGLIIVANKWDVVDDKDTKAYTRRIHAALPFVRWAPVVFLSALHKTKLTQLLDTVLAVAQARTSELPETALNDFLHSAVRHATPLSNAKIRGILKHKLPKPQLKNLEQTGTNPPVFGLTAKAKLGVKDTYITYLENRLRKEFGLIGTPVKIKIVDRK